MKCTQRGGGRRMNVAMNCELLEVVECFEYLGFKITVGGRIETGGLGSMM